MANRSTSESADLNGVVASLLTAFPKLDLFEQRLSLELYRQLAAGQPVPRATLAELLQVPIETLSRTIDGWPGVFSDAQKRVVGYWGISLATAYASPHRLTVDGRRLSAWCAWDTLFLPQLLGKSAAIESTSPSPAVTVRLSVTPEGVKFVDPADTHVSFLTPDTASFQKDVVSTFCHFVHFFPSRRAGETWVAQHPGTFILSVADAHIIAARKNEAQYGAALG